MTRTTVEKYARHVNPSFVKLLGVLGYGRVFVRAKDVWLWDDEDRQYVDFLAGFGAVNIGHNHPRLIRRLRKFLDDAPNLVHTGPSAQAAELAEALASLLPDPLEVSLFSTSGAEGVEAAMKLARAATGRRGFVYCDGGFHGTSPGALSIMGGERLRKPFEPLLAGCVAVPFGDLTALEEALRARRAAGFVVEPIQSEGGVVIPPARYFEAARALCRRYGTLFILDEVQTGLGRTGSMFAAEVVPDVLVLAKSLGGSIAPIAVTVTSRRLHARAYGSMDRFDLHGSTFSGNAFSCVAALETLRILSDEELVENSRERGTQLLESLRRRLGGHPLVRDVRGRGLLVGVELGPADCGWKEKVMDKVFGQWVALRLLEKGIVCQPAVHRWRVLKLEPPLTVRSEEVERVTQSVEEVLNEYPGVTPVLRDVVQRVGSQFLSGWSF